MPKKTLSRDLIDFICLKYNEGKSFKRIAREVDLSDTFIKSILIRENVPLRNEIYRKYKLKEDFFSEILSEEQAYWLGFIYADGYIPKRKSGFEINLSIKDIDTLEKLNKAIKSDKPLVSYRGGISNTEFVRFSVSSLKLKHDLGRIGCTNKKTFTLLFPELPPDLIHHFIRGYFDGDGSIGFSYNTRECNKKTYRSYWFHISGTFAFCESLKSIINKNCNLDSGIIYKNSSIYRLHYSSLKDIKKIKDYLYKNCFEYMERKKNKFEEIYAQTCGTISQ